MKWYKIYSAFTHKKDREAPGANPYREMNNRKKVGDFRLDDDTHIYLMLDLLTLFQSC